MYPLECSELPETLAFLGWFGGHSPWGAGCGHATHRAGHPRHPRHAAAPGHLLHEAPHLLEVGQHLVDIGRFVATACGDAAPARGLGGQQLWLLAFDLRHRADHRFDLLELLLPLLEHAVVNLVHAGDQLDQAS